MRKVTSILLGRSHVKEINFLISTLTSKYSNVLVSLHPKMNKNKYITVLKDYNCTIIEEKLDQIIGITDLYVATNSSTINWAILLGIKQLLYVFMD